MFIYTNQAVRIEFNIGIDTDLTTSIVLKYRKPDGTIDEFTPINITDSETGDVYYDASDGEIDTEGGWVFWSLVTTTDGSFPGHPFFIEVVDAGESITNKDFVKSYLGITTDDDDAFIEANILAAEQDYLNIRNIPWDVDALGNKIYPPGANTVIADMIGHLISLRDARGKEVESESIDSYSVTYRKDGARISGTYPSWITSRIKKYIDGR